MTFQPTQEQLQAIELSAQPQNTRLKMLAYAGAGKTSTIVLIAQKLGEFGLKGVYLAFNKAIANEAGQKMPRNATAKTFHSLAFGNVDNRITAKLNIGQGLYANNFTNWSRYYGTTNVTGDTTKHRPNGTTNHVEQVDSGKRFKIIKRAIEIFLRSDSEAPEDWHLDYAIDSTLNMKVNQDHKQHLITEFMPLLNNLWYDFQQPNGNFKITHDVYLKIYALSNPKINYDFILFDESQDTDKLMLGILKQQTNRIIFVGDPYQQIYEWRGAVDAMAQFEGIETYLTQSFRFGEAIATLANGLLRYLKAEKPLIGAGQQGFVDTSNPFPHDTNAILCRTNAGAIGIALEYLERHKNRRLYLELSGSPQEMLDLLKAINDFETNPQAGRYHEILANFADFAELKEYCEQFPNDQNISGVFRLYMRYGYQYLSRTIEAFRSNEQHHDVTITTVHKAKGREWENVLLADDFEGRSFSVDTKANVKINGEAEARLLYVAITRAKKGLYGANIEALIKFLSRYSFENPLPTDPANTYLSSLFFIEDEETEEQAGLKQEQEATPPQPTAPKAEKPTITADNNKRKYTPRSREAEQRRLEACREGHKVAVELGMVGRPKALEDNSHAIELIKKGELSLPKIAQQLGVSLSTIKRIKQAQKFN